VGNLSAVSASARGFGDHAGDKSSSACDNASREEKRGRRVWYLCT